MNKPSNSPETRILKPETKQTVSRRDFLKGLAGVFGAAALGAAGCTTVIVNNTDCDEKTAADGGAQTEKQPEADKKPEPCR